MIKHSHATYIPKYKLARIKKALSGLPEEQMANYMAAHKAAVGNPLFVIAARLARLYWPEFIKFIKLMKEADTNLATSVAATLPQHMPLMVSIPKEPSRIGVFPNIRINTMFFPCSSVATWKTIDPEDWRLLSSDGKNLININAIQNMNVLKDALETYDPNDQKYLNVNRIWQRVKKFERMSLAKALTKYVMPSMKPDYIRDFAATIEEIMKPMAIHWANTPKEFEVMYSSGPSSCMTIHRGEGGGWKHLWEEIKLAPVHFYAYCPFTKGAYIKRGPTVLARTIVYEYAPGKFGYGRMYGDQKSVSSLANALSEAGVTALPSKERDQRFNLMVDGVYRPDVEFKIPPYRYSEDICYPITYFDNAHNRFSLSVDAEDNLVCRQSKDANAYHMGGPAGYIMKTAVSRPTCAACKSPMREQQFLVSKTEHVFCSHTCANSREYTLARRSDNTGIWVPKNDPLLVTALDTGTVYENERAARAHGGGTSILITEEGLEEDLLETPRYVMHGREYMINRERHKVRMHLARWDSLLEQLADVLQRGHSGNDFKVNITGVNTVIFNEEDNVGLNKLAIPAYVEQPNNTEVAPGMPADSRITRVLF